MTIPVQERSRATQRKILDAAERLLQTRRFDEIAMSDLAREAAVSIGGLYARFGAKEDLLESLYARYEARRSERRARTLEPSRWEGIDLVRRVRGVVTTLVGLMSKERHILRSFLLHHWSNPQEIGGPFAQRLETIYENAAAVIALDPGRIGASDPQRAARAAVAVVAGACRDMVVMKPAPAPGAVEMTQEEIVETLTHAALGILQYHEGDTSA
ncbi:MAG TPA: helix-turn-helix domain-containing protein [Candidatus Krumholzibacteria bacterium]|nr:helix-turn-helix domain-containing protein [Candidatus Krumholzibacteria bacterium]